MRVLFLPQFNVEYSIPLCKNLAEYCDLTIAVWVKDLQQFQFKGAELACIGGDGKFPDISHSRSLVRQVNKLKPDLVHFQAPYTWSALVAGYLGRTVVTTIHDVVPHPGRKVRLYRVALKQHVKASAGLIVHGEKLAQQLRSKYPESSRKLIRVLPHGPLEKYCQFPVADSHDRDYFLFFGRIYAYKGIGLFLDALRISKQSDGRGFRAVIAGAGDISEYKERMRALDNLEVINRFITDQEAANLVAGARAVVLPYREASQSGVISAAYALGRPVIVTDVGALPEAVVNERTGFIVPPDNEFALFEAMQRLNSDDELLARLETGVERFVSDHLSWHAIAQRTSSFYRELLSLA